MDRFFSKLDLRDIKIKPEGNRFLPTDDDEVVEDETAIIDEPAARFDQPASHFSVDASPLAMPANGVEDMNGHLQVDHAVNGVDMLALDGSDILKVSARSRPSAVAGAIAGVIREKGRAEVQAIGAGATNQAVKAVAIARDYLLESGIDAICIPEFIDVTIDNEERTAIRLIVEARAGAH